MFGISINWDKTLINSFRTFVGILFGIIALERLKDIIIFWEKNILHWLGGENNKNYFFEYLVENWMLVASLTKYSLKTLAISCVLVFLWPLSKILMELY